MTTALIVVDVQNDFIDGSLPVMDAEQCAVRISNYVQGQQEYDFVVSTQDWHPTWLDAHFSKTPDYKTTWPVHCVATSKGSDLHPALDKIVWDATFRKGQTSAAYSGFEGVDAMGQSLGDWLRENGVTEVNVVGIATDFCVKATALDAVKEGFSTKVLLPFTAFVSNEGLDSALEAFEAAGVGIV